MTTTPLPRPVAHVHVELMKQYAEENAKDEDQTQEAS